MQNQPIESRFWGYLKRKFAEILFMSVVFLSFGLLLYNVLIPFAYTPQERKELEYINQRVEKPAWVRTHPKEFQVLYKRKEEIESKYALYKAFPLKNFKAYLIAFISFSLPALLFVIFSNLYIHKKRNFFFRVGEKEPPLKLGKPVRLLLFKDTSKPILSLTEKEFVKIVFGGDYRNYAKVMAFMNGEIIETDKIKFPLISINKRIEEFTDQLAKWGYATYKLQKEDEKVFRASVYLSLLHYTASLYGNIPVSFLSPFIKNDIVNDFKSFYYYGKLPVKLGKVRDFLTIFHTFPVDILEALKKEFTPLSFEKYDDFYFREEFFKNALSDYEEEQKFIEELNKEEKEEEKIMAKLLSKIKAGKEKSSSWFKKIFPF